MARNHSPGSKGEVWGAPPGVQRGRRALRCRAKAKRRGVPRRLLCFPPRPANETAKDRKKPSEKGEKARKFRCRLLASRGERCKEPEGREKKILARKGFK